jgi:hypothetical protein
VLITNFNVLPYSRLWRMNNKKSLDLPVVTDFNLLHPFSAASLAAH